MKHPITAFNKWLLRESNGDRGVLVAMLKKEVVSNHNPQAFELLEQTGDKVYTQDTFVKAANLLLAVPLDTATEENRTKVILLEGGKEIDVDIEIADLVEALNKCGVKTIASCSGHGFQPARISLPNAEIMITTFEQAQKITRIFPGINGEPPLDP